MLQYIKFFLGFVLNPSSLLDKNTILPASRRDYLLFSLVSDLVFSLVLAACGMGIAAWVGVDVSRISQSMESLQAYPVWMTLLFSVFLAPLVEEAAFRLGLSMSRAEAFAGLGIFLIYLTLTLGVLDIWMAVLISVLLLLVFQTSESGLRLWMTKYFNFLIYLSVLSFGLVHLSNYSLDSQTWWLGLGLILPQIWGGLHLADIRVRYGFVWSLGLHVVYNLVVMLVVLYLRPWLGL